MSTKETQSDSAKTVHLADWMTEDWYTIGCENCGRLMGRGELLTDDYDNKSFIVCLECVEGADLNSAKTVHSEENEPSLKLYPTPYGVLVHYKTSDYDGFHPLSSPPCCKEYWVELNDGSWEKNVNLR